MLLVKNWPVRSRRYSASLANEYKSLVMTHASNVLGTILPIEECFQWAQQKGLLTILDAAQTAGFLPIK